MTDAFTIQTIERPSGHFSVQQPTSVVGNPAPPEPTGARGQGSDSENRLPHSWTCYSQPLPLKRRQNEQLKKNCRKYPIFHVLRIQIWVTAFLRIYESPAKSETWENRLKKKLFAEVLFSHSKADSNLLEFHLFLNSLFLFQKRPAFTSSNPLKKSNQNHKPPRSEINHVRQCFLSFYT